LQSQTGRCESDIHNDMYDSITDNCHAGWYCGKYCDYSDYRQNIEEIEKYNIYG